MTNINSYFPILNLFGFVILAAALWYTQWRSGSKTISSEVMDNYKALDGQQKEQIDRLTRDVLAIRSEMRTMEKDYIKQISELRGQITEKDRHIKELQDTINLRNPEFLDVLNSIKDFMEKLDSKMEDSRIVKEKMLVGQNEMKEQINDKTKEIMDKSNA